MREIGLYRGKRKDGNGWFEGYYVGPIDIIDDHEICDINDILGSRIEVDPSTVGQFTGRAFGGKRTFEGDILHIPDEERDVMIAWDEYALAFMAVDMKDGEKIWLCEYADDDMFWVGTKWDNPELLEATT